MHRLIALALVAGLPTASVADSLIVTFRDGAPKDRFKLQHRGDCAPGRILLEIDLGTAPAGLIFDITAAGAGVEVYQPLEWVQGLATTSDVTDGDTTLSLTLDRMQRGETRAFTVDIDDTTSARQITVDGSEMAGATLRSGATVAVFDATGTARLPLDACTS